MLFKGTFVGEASGKMGGTVFSRNKGGAYIKQFVMGTNPNTAYQAAQRAILSSLIAAWRAITPVKQELWNQAGPDYSYVNRVGDTKTRSGYQAFMFVNGNVQAAGGPPFRTGEVVDVPPGLVAPTSLGGTVVVTLVEEEVPVVTMTTTIAGDTDNRLIVWATKPLGSGISSPSRSAYRVIGYTNDTTTPGAFLFGTAYSAKFGAGYLENQKVGIRIEQVNARNGVKVTLYDDITIVTV